ncbi:MAG: hypothetical protein ACRDQU_04775 [Pseudonocardiaceae bacterium]
MGDYSRGARRSGGYVGLCGRLVMPAALVAPPGPTCPACAAVLKEGRRQQRSRNPGVLARLTGLATVRQGKHRRNRVARSVEYPLRRRDRRSHPMMADSPDLVIAKLLVDHLKLGGFQFRRPAPGEDGPLVGDRVSDDWLDFIHIEGFSCDCLAWRKRISSLIVPGHGLVERRVHGHAITVPKDLLVHTHRHGDQHTAPCRGAHPHQRRP